MKFIELFAGIGGFRLGLERAGHKCVWANEWLEKPRRIYAKQFGEKPDGRDIRTVRAEDIPEADFICGGFPCATFSIAGKRTGFSLEDTRGTLAFEMFRLARDKRIPYIFFENVKGFLNHDNGRTFRVILECLDGMGYDAQWELLDSKNFGVPQHRERIFLIANTRGKSRPKVFPIGKTNGENAEKETQTQPEILQFIRRENEFRRFTDGISPTLLAHMGTGGGNVPFVHAKIYAQSLGRKNIRKLSPLECERLQGLPDDFTKWMLDDSGDSVKTPDSERYERCGRTVTIPVIEAIGKKFGYEWY